MLLKPDEIRERLQYLDHISLVGIKERGLHGVLDHERQDGQFFSVDADIYLDMQPAGRSDHLADTVDYSQVSSIISRIISGEPQDLLETVATQIAEETLALPNVQAVRICVHKPDAPLGVEKEDVSVTIWRGLDNLKSYLPEEVEDSQPDTEQLDLKEITAAAPSPNKEDITPFDQDNSDTSNTDGAQAENDPAEQPSKQGDSASGGLSSPLEQVPSAPRQAVIALGGNIGNVSETFRQVISQLSAASGVGIVEVSPLVRTSAVLAAGQKEQPDYLNAVILVSTMLSPLGLLDLLQGIEDEHGRKRTERWAARTLDLDIIDYQGVTSDDERLELPHPRAAKRAFVLLPWSLIAPTAQLAGAGEVVVLADYAPDRDGVKEIYPNWLGSEHPQTEAGSGALPLPRWSALTRPPAAPRVLDDARELHPSAEIPQLDSEGAAVSAEEAVTSSPLPPLPPVSNDSPALPTAVTSEPLPRLNTEIPQPPVILDEGIPARNASQAAIAAAGMGEDSVSNAPNPPADWESSTPVQEVKKKSIWQRIKAFFIGEKTGSEQYLNELSPADESSLSQDAAQPIWQSVSPSSAPCQFSGDEQLSSVPNSATTAESPEDIEENSRENTVPAPLMEEDSRLGNPAESAAQGGDIPAKIAENENRESDSDIEQVEEEPEYGSGRHAGKLVTGPIPTLENPPRPDSLDITEQDLSRADDNAPHGTPKVERRSILRPTTTGAIPIVKPENDATDQPTEFLDPADRG